MSRLERFLYKNSDSTNRSMCFTNQANCTCCSFTIGKEIIDDQNMIIFIDKF